jgi:Polyketide cyclase / dehydrase and lipid transport
MAESRHVVTVTESIWIDRSPEDVFDYTQDYARRTEWDTGISAAKLVDTEPRTARIRVKNLGTMTVVYRLDRRPERTSAAFNDVDSAWVNGGGGSWQYEPENGGTRWQQTNSLELKRPWLGVLVGPLLESGLRHSTRTSMAEAKRRLEAKPKG